MKRFGKPDEVAGLVPAGRGAASVMACLRLLKVCSGFVTFCSGLFRVCFLLPDRPAEKAGD